MAKERTQIPEDIAAAVLVASDHTCCKCEERGAPIQIHHIDENPANNDFENLAVLCLRCHHDTQVSGGFSRKLSATDVRMYRHQWIARVTQRRKAIDEILIKKATDNQNISKNIQQSTSADIRGRVPEPRLTKAEISALIEQLPDLLAREYDRARVGWSGTTADMRNATYSVIDLLETAWLRLSQAYPENHFGGIPAERYVNEFLANRFAWYRAVLEPNGHGTGGTIVGVRAGGHVLSDIEDMVRDTVLAIEQDEYPVTNNKSSWLSRWNNARGREKDD